MQNLELITTEDLLNEVARRQEAKEITYCMVIASDDGEYFEISHNLDEEQLCDVAEILIADESWDIKDI